MTIFMFAPGISSILGRSFMASSIPFGLCAAPGLLALLRAVRHVRWRRRVVAIVLCTSSFYGVYSLAQPYWIAAFGLDPRAEYETRAEAALLERLAPQVSGQDVVLTTYLDGLFVPAQSNARAFTGHPEMTIGAGRKSDSWNAAERDRFLSTNHIAYVLTSDPRAVGRLADDPDLVLIDLEQGAALFMVRR